MLYQSATKKQIKMVVDQVTGQLVCGPDKKLREYKEYYYLCSLKKLPESRLMSAFPEAEPAKEAGSYGFINIRAKSA